MSWAAVAIGGTALVTSAINYEASRKSASQQAAAAESDRGLQQYMFDTSRADLEPFRQLELEGAQIGTDALKALSEKVYEGPGQFKGSDSYRFALGQGLSALDRSAIASGRSRNADTMRFAQGLASTELDNFLNRYQRSLQPLQSIARVPTGATSQQVGVNQAFANRAGQSLYNQGQAAAAGTINAANTWTSGINNALNNYLMWQYMQ